MICLQYRKADSIKCSSYLKGILPGGPKSRLWDHGGSPFENHQFSKFWLHFKVSESSNVFWGNRDPTTISKSTEEEISCPSPILQCNKINVSIEHWCWDCTWPYYFLNFVLSFRTSLLVQCDHQKKIWYPHLTFIHFEIFRMLRAFAVKMRRFRKMEQVLFWAQMWN